MKTSQRQSRSACSLRFFLGIFLVLFTCVKAENKTWPQANLNLTPTEQWRSAFYCLQNTSSNCTKYVLSMSGWLNVTLDDGETFCQAGGCAEHTRAVLDCINHVKRDFWFANKATVKNLNDTINIGCKSGFNGTSIYSGGYRVNSAPISSALLGLVLLALLYI